MPDRKRQPTAASVDIQEVPPVRSPEVLIAQYEGQSVTTVERTKDEDGNPVVTEHTRPGTLIMYKPTERHGYVPRTVSASAIKMLLRQGWYEFCPDCRQKHVDKNGQESTDPNLCTAREPVKVRICRVCRKRIYDNVRFNEPVEGELEDENIIQDALYDQTTAEQRTAVLLNLHYWMRHPNEAMMMSIPPLPQPLKEMAEAARPV